MCLKKKYDGRRYISRRKFYVLHLDDTIMSDGVDALNDNKVGHLFGDTPELKKLLDEALQNMENSPNAKKSRCVFRSCLDISNSLDQGRILQQ